MRFKKISTFTGTKDENEPFVNITKKRSKEKTPILSDIL